MSKKSRRRNKRLLMLAALAGGAAMMGRGKGMSGKETISDAQKAHNFASDAAVTGISKPDTSGANAASKKVFLGNTRLKRNGMGPMESVIAKRKIPGYGTAVAPPGILNPYRRPRGLGPRRFSKGGSVKKARVTGAAKRGFGRALMKGKK